MARRRMPSTSGRGPAPSTRPSAPNARYTPSTSPMAACTASWPMRSGKSPPTSLDSDSLPSENAPAPENPVVMRHGSQPRHGPPACLGHVRSSTASPLSSMTMRPANPRSTSASAQKMPAGPAPTMTTSVSCAPMARLLRFPARRRARTAAPFPHCSAWPAPAGARAARRILAVSCRAEKPARRAGAGLTEPKPVRPSFDRADQRPCAPEGARRPWRIVAGAVGMTCARCDASAGFNPVRYLGRCRFVTIGCRRLQTPPKRTRHSRGKDAAP